MKKFFIKWTISFIIVAITLSAHFYSRRIPRSFEDAIETGDYDKVKQMLSEDKNIMRHTYPLFRAINGFRTDIAELLIDYGADINEKQGDRHHGTPLIYVTSCQNIDMMEFLLKKGAMVDLTDDFGRTALINAAKIDYTKGMELLLDNGAEINHKDQYIRTALDYALLYNHYKSVRYLLSRGAKTDNVRAIIRWKIPELKKMPNPSEDTKNRYINTIQVLQEYDDNDKSN